MFDQFYCNPVIYGLSTIVVKSQSAPGFTAALRPKNKEEETKSIVAKSIAACAEQLIP